MKSSKGVFVKSTLYFMLVTSGFIGIFGRSNTGFAKFISNAQASAYLDTLTSATYDCILAMLEPGTGLPHDRFDASLFDIFPQFAVVRTFPYADKSDNANLVSWRDTAYECKHSGNYRPNPFNLETVISYSIPDFDFVGLKVYDISGREVCTLINKCQKAGKHSITFDASKLASGIYIYELKVGKDFKKTGKMLYIK